MRERSKDWIEEAENDIKHAENDLKNGFYSWACFSTQQAGEKAIKGVFQKIGIDAWGYSISDLLIELSKKFKVPKNLIEISDELDKAYIPTRYPDVFPSGSPKDKYTKKEAERLIRYGKKSLSSVKLFYPKYKTEEIIKKLNKDIKKIKNIVDIEKVVLFGSYAKGNYTGRSDIDVFFLVKSKKNKNLYKIIKKTFYYLIYHIFSQKLNT